MKKAEAFVNKGAIYTYLNRVNYVIYAISCKMSALDHRGVES